MDAWALLQRTAAAAVIGIHVVAGLTGGVHDAMAVRLVLSLVAVVGGLLQWHGRWLGLPLMAVPAIVTWPVVFLSLVGLAYVAALFVACLATVGRLFPRRA